MLFARLSQEVLSDVFSVEHLQFFFIFPSSWIFNIPMMLFYLINELFNLKDNTESRTIRRQLLTFRNLLELQEETCRHSNPQQIHLPSSSSQDTRWAERKKEYCLR